MIYICTEKIIGGNYNTYHHFFYNSYNKDYVRVSYNCTFFKKHMLYYTIIGNNLTETLNNINLNDTEYFTLDTELFIIHETIVNNNSNYVNEIINSSYLENYMLTKIINAI